jgi:hypothetical protein
VFSYYVECVPLLSYCAEYVLLLIECVLLQAGKEAGRTCAMSIMDFNRPKPDSDYGVRAPILLFLLFKRPNPDGDCGIRAPCMCVCP